MIFDSHHCNRFKFHTKCVYQISLWTLTSLCLLWCGDLRIKCIPTCWNFKFYWRLSSLQFGPASRSRLWLTSHFSLCGCQWKSFVCATQGMEFSLSTRLETTVVVVEPCQGSPTHHSCSQNPRRSHMSQEGHLHALGRQSFICYWMNSGDILF